MDIYKFIYLLNILNNIFNICVVFLEKLYIYSLNLRELTKLVKTK